MAPIFAILEEMKINLKPEQESRLRELAAARGTNAETLVEQAALTLLEENGYDLCELNEQLERMLRC